MVKYKTFRSDKHYFLDVKGRNLNIFRAFDSEDDLINHLNQLKRSKYWK